MGVTPNIMLHLAEFSGRYQTTAPALMLGRQKFRLGGAARRWTLDRALSGLGTGLRLDHMLQPDGFAETMFTRLGFPAIETLDANLYEMQDGATAVVHDLNTPVPKDLHGRYGFIFDGGTLEHVFNVPQALESMFHLLAPGGRMIGVNPLNGWPAHGMYQFTAELIYGFWQRMAGCRIVNCRAYRGSSTLYSKDIADPATTGRRTRYRHWSWPFSKVPPGQIFLHYEVEKIAGATMGTVAAQPDYLAAWNSSAKGMT